MHRLKAKGATRELSRRHLLIAGAAAGAGALIGLRPAAAVLRLDVTQGNVQPLPIALPEFVAGSAADGEVPRNVTQIITGNLRRSGLFAPIDPAAFIERIVNVDAMPRFADWRAMPPVTSA